MIRIGDLLAACRVRDWDVETRAVASTFEVVRWLRSVPNHAPRARDVPSIPDLSYIIAA